MLTKLSVPLVLSESSSLRYFVFFYLYVMQGIPAGFSLTALANYLTAEGVKPSVIGSFAAVIGLPWAFQFIWGPLIDRYQSSSLGRRKPWVIGTQFLAFLASLGILLIDNPLTELKSLVFFFLIHSIFAAIQDASVDAMAITVIPAHERGRVNAFMRAGFLVGTGVGAAVFSQILRQFGFSEAALIQSLCLMTLWLLTCFVRERPEDRLLPFLNRRPPVLARTTKKKAQPDRDFKWLFTELFTGIFAPQNLLLFAAVVTAYVSISLFLRAYNYHLIQKMGWADTSLSLLTGTYGMLVAAATALFGGYVADRIGPSRLLILVLGLVAAYLLGFNLLEATWTNQTVARSGLVALYFMDPAVSVAAMPLLMAICRPGVEGSQFTTYMAFVNLADIAGSYLAGHALVYIQAPTLGLVAGGLSAVAMISTWLTIRQNKDLSEKPYRGPIRQRD
ncbi:MFS transporter [Larkinella terrae]|uniref:MFS transporter n=1 Tax=Larkinella terrae TaxID=2025311 RepID=A0A7K0EGG3_9BACT|nr:MFS transporter [Larkinella terrae]MRS60904.1 MFS transporter [Larkinella terrae]